MSTTPIKQPSHPEVAKPLASTRRSADATSPMGPTAAVVELSPAKGRGLS